jgi:hypothetical protein
MGHVCVLLMLSCPAVQMPSNRKMLALSGKVTTTAVVNPPPVPVPVQRQYRPYNQADAQFAANNQAIINTQVNTHLALRASQSGHGHSGGSIPKAPPGLC